VMLASKFFDDLYYNNAYYARVGGISNLEVNNLEIELLRMISFSLYVSPEQYERYRASLYEQIRWKGVAAGVPGATPVPMPVAIPVQGSSPPLAGAESPADVSAPALDHSQSQHFHAAANALGAFHAVHQTAFVN